jgi:sec1 family domain-containing protein 1
MQQAQLLSLRELQRRALLKLLNLNSEEYLDQDLQPNDQVLKGDNPVWKFLIFDELGQKIISSILRVSDLREAGVTVHMQLKADRQQMEDIPASMFNLVVFFLIVVYLIEPTPENINLIADVHSA